MTYYRVQCRILNFGVKENFLPRIHSVKRDRNSAEITVTDKTRRQAIWRAMDLVMAAINLEGVYHTKANYKENYVLVYDKSDTLIGALKDFEAIERLRLKRWIEQEECDMISKG